MTKWRSLDPGAKHAADMIRMGYLQRFATEREQEFLRTVERQVQQADKWAATLKGRSEQIAKNRRALSQAATKADESSLARASAKNTLAEQSKTFARIARTPVFEKRRSANGQSIVVHPEVSAGLPGTLTRMLEDLNLVRRQLIRSKDQLGAAQDEGYRTAIEANQTASGFTASARTAETNLGRTSLDAPRPVDPISEQVSSKTAVLKRETSSSFDDGRLGTRTLDGRRKDLDPLVSELRRLDQLIEQVAKARSQASALNRISQGRNLMEMAKIAAPLQETLEAAADGLKNIGLKWDQGSALTRNRQTAIAGELATARANDTSTTRATDAMTSAHRAGNNIAGAYSPVARLHKRSNLAIESGTEYFRERVQQQFARDSRTASDRVEQQFANVDPALHERVDFQRIEAKHLPKLFAALGAIDAFEAVNGAGSKKVLFSDQVLPSRAMEEHRRDVAGVITDFNQEVPGALKGLDEMGLSSSIDLAQDQTTSFDQTTPGKLPPPAAGPGPSLEL